MKKQAITIYDVAELAQVSIATVSRTISKPEKVSAKTLGRVLNAIHALDWQPDKGAQHLALILATYRKKGA